MEIVYDNHELEEYMKEAVKVSPEHPILVDKFLEDAIELAAIETASLNMKPTKKRVALNMLISSIRNHSNAN